MLVVEAINGFKSKYQIIYANYLRSLIGAFHDVFMSAPFLYSDGLKRFDNLAYQAKLALDASLSSTLYNDYKSLSNIVEHHVNDKAEEELIDLLVTDIANDVKSNIITQAEKDFRQFRQVAIESIMGIMQSNAFDAIGLQNSLRKIAEHRLVMLSKNGRRWKSEKYIEVLLNWTLHRVYNEVFVFLAKNRGKQQLQALLPSTKETTLFTIADYANQELQNKLFHPNSQRIVID